MNFDFATPEEVHEAFDPTWEDMTDVFREVISSVNDALDNSKATREEIIERLTFLVTGANQIVFDLIDEGRRMTPRQNLQAALVTAQCKALDEMHNLQWRK